MQCTQCLRSSPLPLWRGNQCLLPHPAATAEAHTAQQTSLFLRLLAEPSRAEPSRAEPSRVEPSRVEPSRAEQSRAEPSRAEQSRAEPSRAEPSRAAKPAGRQRQYQSTWSVTSRRIYVTGNVWNQAFYRMSRQPIECPAGQAFYRS